MNKGGLAMEETAKTALNAYMKAYRAKNKDKIKAINSRYWNKKASLEKPPDPDEGSLPVKQQL